VREISKAERTQRKEASYVSRACIVVNSQTMSRAPATFHTNPLKEDPVLRKILKKIDTIRDAHAFDHWRDSFLTRFIEYLDQNGADAAEASYWDLSDHTMSGGLVKSMNKLSGYIEHGAITQDKCSVKARQCIQELHQHMTLTSDAIEGLVPGTYAQEKKAGYTKFHMGAVLVRDGFREYARLSLAADVLDRLVQVHLLGVADKQLLLELKRYNDKLKSFCDVMADLGLFAAMLKCREFIHADEDEEIIILAYPDFHQESSKLLLEYAQDNNQEKECDFDPNTGCGSLDRDPAPDSSHAESDMYAPNDSYTSLSREPAPYSSHPDTNNPMESLHEMAEREAAPYSSHPQAERFDLKEPAVPLVRDPAPYSSCVDPPKMQRDPAPYSSSFVEQERSNGKEPTCTLEREPAPYNMHLQQQERLDPTESARSANHQREPAPYASHVSSERCDPKVTTGAATLEREPAPYSAHVKQNGFESKKRTPINLERKAAPYSASVKPERFNSEMPSSISLQRESAPYSYATEPPRSPLERNPAPYSFAAKPMKKSSTDTRNWTRNKTSPTKRPSTSNGDAPKRGDRSGATSAVRTPAPYSYTSAKQKESTASKTSKSAPTLYRDSSPYSYSAEPKSERVNVRETSNSVPTLSRESTPYSYTAKPKSDPSNQSETSKTIPTLSKESSTYSYTAEPRKEYTKESISSSDCTTLPYREPAPYCFVKLPPVDDESSNTSSIRNASGSPDSLTLQRIRWNPNRYYQNAVLPLSRAGDEDKLDEKVVKSPPEENQNDESRKESKKTMKNEPTDRAQHSATEPGDDAPIKRRKKWSLKHFFEKTKRRLHHMKQRRRQKPRSKNKPPNNNSALNEAFDQAAEDSSEDASSPSESETVQSDDDQKIKEVSPGDQVNQAKGTESNQSDEYHEGNPNMHKETGNNSKATERPQKQKYEQLSTKKVHPKSPKQEANVVNCTKDERRVDNKFKCAQPLDTDSIHSLATVKASGNSKSNEVKTRQNVKNRVVAPKNTSPKKTALRNVVPAKPKPNTETRPLSLAAKSSGPVDVDDSVSEDSDFETVEPDADLHIEGGRGRTTSSISDALRSDVQNKPFNKKSNDSAQLAATSPTTSLATKVSSTEPSEKIGDTISASNATNEVEETKVGPKVKLNVTQCDVGPAPSPPAPDIRTTNKSIAIPLFTPKEGRIDSPRFAASPEGSVATELPDSKSTEKQFQPQADQVAPKKMENKPVDIEMYRKSLMWHARLGQPDRETMKKKVANLPDACDITPEDVDDLPWICGGKLLNVRAMNKLFLENAPKPVPN
jgi:hypothetical protein